MKFVIFNGPPYSGKSTVARELARALSGRYRVAMDSFAAPMKHFIATALGEQYNEMPKDSPKDILRGRSVRQFLIHMSEQYMKEQYGQDIYGRLLYHRAMRYQPAPDFVICDDSGFPDEAMALPEPYIVRVTRKGKDYTGDSRTYLPNPSYVFENDDALDELWIPIRKLVVALEGGVS